MQRICAYLRLGCCGLSRTPATGQNSRCLAPETLMQCIASTVGGVASRKALAYLSARIPGHRARTTLRELVLLPKGFGHGSKCLEGVRRDRTEEGDLYVHASSPHKLGPQLSPLPVTGGRTSLAPAVGNHIHAL